jgi:hypothetical protein
LPALFADERVLRVHPLVAKRLRAEEGEDDHRDRGG